MKSNLLGRTFGRLTVTGDHDKRDRHRNVIWECTCSCGSVTECVTGSLVSGSTRSCGCLDRETKTTHGCWHHILTQRWYNMIARCYKEANHNYKYYGGRGIKVCAEWRRSPKLFIEWAEANGFKRELEIDRRDNNEGYSPDNCRWVTHTVNMNNKGY